MLPKTLVSQLLIVGNIMSKIELEYQNEKALQSSLMQQKQIMNEKVQLDDVAKLILDFPSNEQFSE